jgi:GT2 family glycosyltransferase
VIEDFSNRSNNRELVYKFERVGYIQNEERLGIARNFNKCLNSSTGLFTQIIGSDDVFMSEVITKIEKDLVIDPDLTMVINDIEVINKNESNFYSDPRTIKK